MWHEVRLRAEKASTLGKPRCCIPMRFALCFLRICISRFAARYFDAVNSCMMGCIGPHWLQALHLEP